MKILDHLQSEWDVLRRAPLSFVILIGLAFSGGFYVQGVLKQQEISNYESAIKAKNGQLDALRGQLDAYQKSISERLDKVEKTLSESQTTTLQELLGRNPSKINFSTEKNSNNLFEKQMLDVFKVSGWDVGVVDIMGPAGYFSIETLDPKSTKTITDAFKGVDIPFKFFVPDDSSKAQFRIEK